MLGGTTGAVLSTERELLEKVVASNASPFDMSNLFAAIINRASARSQAVGSRSVAVLLPLTGYLDMNLWDKTSTGIVGYIPAMVFENGTVWGPSEFPVELNLLAQGHLPRESIFFRSIVYRLYKRSLRRRVFRYNKGKKIPGIIGLLGLGLFGKIEEGYTDFGLSSDEAPEA